MLIRSIIYSLMLAILCTQRVAQAECWLTAGRTYNIDPYLLYAIAQQESGLNPYAIGHNAQGSYDIGLMQINSRHLPRLRQLGIDEQQLLNDSCLSIMVGASILADFMQRYGYSWKAVGAYNAGGAAGAEKQRVCYARQVWQRYQKLRASAAELPSADMDNLNLKSSVDRSQRKITH